MDEKLKEELDLSHVNEIDMECEIDPEEDDGFGAFVSAPTKQEVKQRVIVDSFDDEKRIPMMTPHGAANDDREINTTLGVTVDFGGDYPEMNDYRAESFTDKVNQEDQIIDLGEVDINQDFSGYNQIDMECSVGEDDDYDTPTFKGNVSVEKRELLDFSDDEEEDKFFVNEEVVKQSVNERKSEIDQGIVEKDYWKRLQKKHAKTNVKGAYNTHFHFSGNPELEMDDFNHDMTPQGAIPNATNANSSGQMLGGENIGGMGESLDKNQYRKLFEDLLNITGFELVNTGNDKCVLKDLYSDKQKECYSINDVEEFLTPYVYDCFIIPLQVNTNQKFEKCDDWVKWYAGDEIKSKYANCAKDISYCDLWANHLVECKLFN